MARGGGCAGLSRLMYRRALLSVPSRSTNRHSPPYRPAYISVTKCVLIITSNICPMQLKKEWYALGQIDHTWGLGIQSKFDTKY